MQPPRSRIDGHDLPGTLFAGRTYGGLIAWCWFEPLGSGR
jgi:hypothetical protein